MKKNNFSKPLVTSYSVVRLRDVTFLRAGKPVPLQCIHAKYMTVQDFVDDAFELAYNLAKRCDATILAYSPRHHCYFPFFNFDPFITFNTLPYNGRLFG